MNEAKLFLNDQKNVISTKEKSHNQNYFMRFLSRQKRRDGMTKKEKYGRAQ